VQPVATVVGMHTVQLKTSGIAPHLGILLDDRHLEAPFLRQLVRRA